MAEGLTRRGQSFCHRRPQGIIVAGKAASRGATLFALLVEGIEYPGELLSFGRVWIDLL
jgi:hypothetical protein